MATTNRIQLLVIHSTGNFVSIRHETCLALSTGKGDRCANERWRCGTMVEKLFWLLSCQLEFHFQNALSCLLIFTHLDHRSFVHDNLEPRRHKQRTLGNGVPLQLAPRRGVVKTSKFWNNMFRQQSGCGCLPSSLSPTSQRNNYLN